MIDGITRVGLMSWAGSWEGSRERFCCEDCGHDTRAMGELYMVESNLWGLASAAWPERGLAQAHMLCIGCLERRIDRKLCRFDFTKAPLNWEQGRKRSLRLRNRLQRERA